jgi:hypothetical protein
MKLSNGENRDKRIVLFVSEKYFLHENKHKISTRQCLKNWNREESEETFYFVYLIFDASLHKPKPL